MNTIEEKTLQLATPLAEALGLVIVEVNWLAERGKYTLQVLADRPGLLSLDDATALSEKLSAALDEADFITKSYYLEVSSPGAERKIKTATDWELAGGKFIHIDLYQKIAGGKTFEGYLIAINETELVLETATGARTIRRELISNARFAIDFRRVDHEK